MFILRWGQPEFVRELVQRQGGKDYVGGAILGSERYIPALDYLTKEGPHKIWRWAFQRQWLFYAVWGQLLYDPATPDARSEAMFDARFGKGVGKDLLAAWKLASCVPLHFASFHQGRADGTLYTEGFSSWRDNAERKLFDIDSFITHPVLDTKRYVNIADFVNANGQVTGGVYSPAALADQLDRDCTSAIKLVSRLRSRDRVLPELDCELTDLEAWCTYGNYFSEKLRPGAALCTARTKSDLRQQQTAVAALERALVHWKRLADLGAEFNKLPVPSNSKEPFSWSGLTPSVQQDIELAKAPLSGSNIKAKSP